MKYFAVSMLIFISINSLAQNNNKTQTVKRTREAVLRSNAKRELKPKKAINLDYNSWSEMLYVTDSSGQKYGAKASYYGIGIGYDYTHYYSQWGYGYYAGLMQGYSIAGDSGAQDFYYQKRIPWTALRASARTFTRLNKRIDVGLALVAIYRQTKWGNDAGFTPVALPNPATGLFIDTRWRLNYKLEVIQSIGTFMKDTGTFWRLGANYTIN